MTKQSLLTIDRQVPATGSGGPVLLYDGLCGFCDRTVQFVLARDRRGQIRYAPLAGEFASAVFKRHPQLQGTDSLVLVERPGTEDETVRVRSDAVTAVVGRLGRGWGWGARFFAVVPRPVRDLGYDAFARRRYRWFGQLDACPLPEPSVRNRFLQ